MKTKTIPKKRSRSGKDRFLAGLGMRFFFLGLGGGGVHAVASQLFTPAPPPIKEDAVIPSEARKLNQIEIGHSKRNEETT